MVIFGWWLVTRGFGEKWSPERREDFRGGMDPPRLFSEVFILNGFKGDYAFDTEREGFLKVKHRKRADVRFPFSFACCNELSYIGVLRGRASRTNTKKSLEVLYRFNPLRNEVGVMP